MGLRIGFAINEIKLEFSLVIKRLYYLNKNRK